MSIPTNAESEDVSFTKEMEDFLRENWSKMSLDELTAAVFNDPLLDSSSKEGRAIRDWIINNGTKNKPRNSTKERSDFTGLTEEHKQFIHKHVESMRPFEIAKLLFPSKKITPLHREFVAVQQFVKKISPESLPKNEALAEDEYDAPQSVYKLIPKVNKYIGIFNIEDAKPLDSKNLNDRDLKNLKALLIYMNTRHFLATINLYEKEAERELFESRFIRYTYNKPDLMEEEVDQYVAICDKAVSLFQLKQQIQILQKKINLNFETDDEKKQKLATNDINLLESYRERETASEKWMEDVLGKLVGSRNARLKGKVAENASVLNLVEAFQSEKKRKELAELFEKYKMDEQKAVDSLATMDGVTALVAGFSDKDAKYL